MIIAIQVAGSVASADLLRCGIASDIEVGVAQVCLHLLHYACRGVLVP